MNIDNLIHLAGSFFHTHTYIAIAILAALAIITYLRPKLILKIIIAIVAAVVIGYILYLLWQALTSGISGKQEMFNK
ncbi:MAG: hypothetical protein KGY56_04140 [Desulfobacterales bacterium]|nr:hypothetical protein [Desulfobacterales bacterium]